MPSPVIIVFTILLLLASFAPMAIAYTVIKIQERRSLRSSSGTEAHQEEGVVSAAAPSSNLVEENLWVC